MYGPELFLFMCRMGAAAVGCRMDAVLFEEHVKCFSFRRTARLAVTPSVLDESLRRGGEPPACASHWSRQRSFGFICGPQQQPPPSSAATPGRVKTALFHWPEGGCGAEDSQASQVRLRAGVTSSRSSANLATAISSCFRCAGPGSSGTGSC